MKHTPTTILLSILSAVFVVVVAFGAFAWYYINQFDVKVLAARDALATLEVSQSHDSELKELVTSSEDSRRLLAQSFLDSSEIADYLPQLEAVGAKSGVEVQIQNLDSREHEEMFGVITLSLTVTGKFSNLLNFITYLENERYGTSLSRIQFTKKGDGPTETGEWGAALDLVVATRK
jgi:hypothetical protein